MPINLASIKNELFPGLAAVEGRYKKTRTEWQRIFEIRQSKMAVERRTQMAYLPLAREKPEGQSSFFDAAAGERWQYAATMKTISLGYIVTREAVEDNLYKTEFNPANLGLTDVFGTTKEIYAANIFNNGTIFDVTIGGDGVSLFNSAHPVDGATIANIPSVPTSLNEGSLLSAMVSINNNWVDERNVKIMARAELLIVPTNLEPIAIRLLRTALRPGTADNDVNAILHTTGGLKDYTVNQFLTSNFAWFLKTDRRGLIYYERIPFEMDMYVDFDTDSLKVKARERYVLAYYDWRATYGSFATN